MSGFRRLKQFYDRYERALIPSVLLIGVLVDFLTFHSIELKTTFTLLGAYAIAAACTIAFMAHYDHHRADRRDGALRYIRLIAPLVVQFTFGALLSASLVFYWVSGSFTASWPVLLLIALLMASNELFRKYYLNPSVQLGVYYFTLFSLCTLLFPFFFNSINIWVFVLAGVVSLAVFILFIRILSRALPVFRDRSRTLIRSAVIILVFMNGLYLLGVIPPIPLSLKEAGAYHSVARAGSTYIVEGEPESFLQRMIPGQTIHLEEGDRAYVFSSVFATAKLSTTIVHEWEFFDPAQRQWVVHSKPSFTITGGRDAGYRGFSFSNRVDPGKWRVSIETERGQRLGRIRFSVKRVSESVTLEKHQK